jgi:hypothetical protein
MEMPNYFSQLWTGDEFRWHRDGAGGLPLRHAASNRFIERGVRSGDLLYVWSFVEGRLLLIGRMEVDAIVSYQEAVRRFGTSDFSDRLSEHAIARSTTEKRFSRELSQEIIRRLVFISPNSKITPPKFRSANEPDPQTFRGIRQLSPESAALLDRIIAVTDRLPRTDQLITVTEEWLRDDGKPGRDLRLPW